MSRHALLAVLLCAGCASTLLAPVPRGRTLVTGSVGGPAVLLGGAPVPVPLSTLGVAHGVSDAVIARGALHPTAAAFGVAGLDLGFVAHPLPSEREWLALGLDAYGFANGHDAVVLADPWIGTRATLTRWLALGGGVHLPIRVATTSQVLRESAPIAPTLFVQPSLLFGRVELAFELRWYALATCGSCAAPEWVSPAGLGAFGVIMGASYRIPEAP